MTRTLTPEEKETLARFDKWLRRLFRGHLLPFKDQHQPFSTAYHIDQWGNVLIDNGRMKLELPDDPKGIWSVHQTIEMLSVSDSSLEEVLLKALDLAMRRDFTNRY